MIAVVIGKSQERSYFLVRGGTFGLVNLLQVFFIDHNAIATNQMTQILSQTSTSLPGVPDALAATDEEVHLALADESFV